MVNTIRAEISQAFASQKKSSTEPSLDSQYACVLTQLLQAQAEIRQDVQKVNEVLCVHVYCLHVLFIPYLNSSVWNTCHHRCVHLKEQCPSMQSHLMQLWLCCPQQTHGQLSAPGWTLSPPNWTRLSQLSIIET